MTCGIYCLYFECDDGLYYIGKSVDIERRFKEHRNKLTKGVHTNQKLAIAYSKYGLPVNEILEISEPELLSTREIFYINKYNSYNDGLNMSIGGDGASPGECNPSSKYSNDKIEEVFRLLITNANLTHQDIATTTGTTKTVVASISQGKNHKWLQEKYPQEYLLLSIVKEAAKDRSNNRRDLNMVDPQGIVHHITNVAKFSRENFLDQHLLGKVIKGIASHHKGWKLLT